MTKTLKAIGITKSFPTAGEPLVVLDGVDLELAPGDAVAITGPSGCGKSTLLHILGTLDTPTSGRILLGDQDPFALSEDGLAGFRRREIGFVFQDHHLLPQCTALENVLVPTLVADTPRGEVEARARSLLQAVGLGDRTDHRPAELSGGERQRAAIARALIQEPPVLLCDEPTGNLDPATARAIGDLFLEIHRERGGVMIVVTHSAELAARLPRQIRLEAGRLEAGRLDPEVSTAPEESGP